MGKHSKYSKTVIMIFALTTPPSWSRSNVLGTKFTIFDNGVNPERKNFVPETTRIREELGAVCYVSFLETRENEAGRWGGERARPTGA